MREILFKAQKLNDKEWIEGYYSKSPDPMFAFLKDFIFAPYFDEKTECGYDNGFQIDINTLCQHTGLSAYWDGLEGELEESPVWEHDLLEVDYEGKKVVAEVKFECGMFILASNEFIDSYIPLFDVVQLEDQGWIDAKVVGNIFDNPELLNIRSEHEFE